MSPNNHEALFGLGLAYNLSQQYNVAEGYWARVIKLYPGYWNAVDHLHTLYSSQHRYKDIIVMLTNVLQSVDLKQVKKTPYLWWKYISLLHTLGEMYCIQSQFYEAALVFAFLLSLALSNKHLKMEELGFSHKVDQSFGDVDKNLESLNNALAEQANIINSSTPKSDDDPDTNPADSTPRKSFLSDLTARIGDAMVQAEKHTIENTPAATCDTTHIIFAKENDKIHFQKGGEGNSKLFIVPPRQALLCKYFLFPPYGQLPIRDNTPEWKTYLEDVTQDNGIKITTAIPGKKKEKVATTSSESEPESVSSSTPNSEETKEAGKPSKPEEKPNQTPTTTVHVQQNSIDNIVSNALLNLAKIFQDGIASGIPTRIIYINGTVPTHHDILGLYLLSLSLNPNPSTANNIGLILSVLASERAAKASADKEAEGKLVTGSPSAPAKGYHALMMSYYNFGLLLDKRNTHIYTNLGSLFRDCGQNKQAIQMYTMAVDCDPNFNIALTNLASALRESGDIDKSIHYYRRAVESSPEFTEAVSGLANSRSYVCDWVGRGGWGWEPMSVNEDGILVWGQVEGWLSNVIKIVDNQIKQARDWGCGVIEQELISFQQGSPSIISDIARAMSGKIEDGQDYWLDIWKSWKNQKDEGTKIVQLIEYATSVCQHRWYMDRLKGIEQKPSYYPRPKIPAGLPIPLATTILPFHAFTLPFTAQQISQIAQRTSIRLSVSSLTASWLSDNVIPPPPPPASIKNISEEDRDLEENNVGKLVVGYVSSDILDHPLAHLMQSVFGFHDSQRFHVICYATTASDGSEYRKKIERESHEFKDVSTFSTERVVQEIQKDGVHILVNLNGFTRGSRNEIFTLRPCPVQICLIGFAGSLGGGWCDYLLGDEQTIGYPHNVKPEEWVYEEKIIYMPRSFFVCDHRQSALDSQAQRELRAAKESTSNSKPFRFLEGLKIPNLPKADNLSIQRADTSNAIAAQSKVDSEGSYEEKLPLLLDEILQTPGPISWATEVEVRKELRRVLFPQLPPDAFLMGNLNQLYKIDPTTFKVWLEILARVPNCYLWLLQFPKSGEAHLKSTAMKWTNNESDIVDRIIFTPIADKHRHILRARVCDLFVDTPECNAHTTAADVVWTGTPILTYPRYTYKMCSRISSSIIRATLPNTPEGHKMADSLIVHSDDEYEERVRYFAGTPEGLQRLNEIRKTIFEQRETNDFFDTRQWTRYVEKGFRQAWRNWVAGEHRHIFLKPETGLEKKRALKASHRAKK